MDSLNDTEINAFIIQRLSLGQNRCVWPCIWKLLGITFTCLTAPFIKGWFTLATEATEAEPESEESSDIVWIGTTEATEADAESEEKETLLILLTSITSSFRFRLRFRFLSYTGS